MLRIVQSRACRFETFSKHTTCTLGVMVMVVMVGVMMVAVGVEVVVVTVMMGGLVMGQCFNNNNNMLYLHDCNKVLQYCKS